MVRRLAPTLVLVLVLVLAASAQAAGPGALQFRQQHGLVPFTAQPAFLSGDFLARENEPNFVFGTVADFAASLTCPAAWLIEEGEQERLARYNLAADPLEYTLYLEEDCPQAARAYVFVVQANQDAKKWLEWRKQFHKSKTDGFYGDTMARLEKAAAGGVVPSSELRFLVLDGDLSVAAPEDYLLKTLKFPPKYDLKTDKPLGR